MILTYPPELLPIPDEGEPVEIVVSDEAGRIIQIIRVVDGVLSDATAASPPKPIELELV